MRHRVKERAEENLVKGQCKHYWMIEVADGPMSRGMCKYCGEAREFFNSIPDFVLPKRHTHPLNLPNLPDVEMEKGSES